MSLSESQKTTLSSDIANNTNTINGTQIKDLPQTADNAFAVAIWYNSTASPNFFGNYKNVPLSDVKAAITFKNYTPVDAVPTSDAVAIAIHHARTLVCQCYQININNLLLVGATFDATKSNLVTGLKDATNSDMPSGVSGAGRKGGWSEVQKVICRLGTNLEKLFADTSNGNGSSNTQAATFTYEEPVQDSEIRTIWGI